MLSAVAAAAMLPLHSIQSYLRADEHFNTLLLFLQVDHAISVDCNRMAMNVESLIGDLGLQRTGDENVLKVVRLHCTPIIVHPNHYGHMEMVNWHFCCHKLDEAGVLEKLDSYSALYDIEGMPEEHVAMLVAMTDIVSGKGVELEQYVIIIMFLPIIIIKYCSCSPPCPETVWVIATSIATWSSGMPSISLRAE